jgi:hypothetical protein
MLQNLFFKDIPGNMSGGRYRQRQLLFAGRWTRIKLYTYIVRQYRTVSSIYRVLDCKLGEPGSISGRCKSLSRELIVKSFFYSLSHCTSALECTEVSVPCGSGGNVLVNLLTAWQERRGGRTVLWQIHVWLTAVIWCENQHDHHC